MSDTYSSRNGGSGGFGDHQPQDLNVGDEESEDEGREEEIKELLAGALPNDTFEDDSDSSYLTNGSFAQNRSITVLRKKNSGAGDDIDNEIVENGHDQEISPRNFPMRMGQGQVDTNGNPNPHPPKPSYSFGFGGGTGLVNGGGRNLNENQNTSSNPNPSGVSMLHTQHCPQVATDSGDQLFGRDPGGTGSGTSMDQLKTLLEFRERQLLRAQETIQTLSQDKRALNHQIGLMKPEAVQIRGVVEDYEMEIKSRDTELTSQTTKFQQLLADYTSLQQLNTKAKEETTRLTLEIGKLNHQLQLRDSVNTTTQLAEVNDAVRQVHEKHGKEIHSWMRKVQELELEIRRLEKSQTATRVVSFAKVDNQTQTTQLQLFSCSSQTEVELDQFQSQEDQPQQIMSLEEQEEAKAWREDKDYLINMYEREIEKWKEEVEALPAQLFQVWEKNAQAKRKQAQPVVCEAGTATTQIQTFNVSTNVDLTGSQKLTIDTQTQTGVGSTNLNSSFSRSIEDLHRMKQFLEGCPTSSNEPTAPAAAEPVTPKPVKVRTFFQTPETSTTTTSVQTEQTLETYAVLNDLISQWITELEESQQATAIAQDKFSTAQQSLEITLEKLAIVTQKCKNSRAKVTELKRSIEKLKHDLSVKDYELYQQKQEEKAGFLRLLGSLHESLAEITNVPM